MKLHSVLPTGRARKPVLLLSLGTFALGTDAFVISGVLPVIGQSLGVGVGAAGQLITIFSAVYAPVAPVLAVLTGNWNRRTALFVAMAVFVAANLLAAVAPNYPVMVVSRVSPHCRRRCSPPPPRRPPRHSPPPPNADARWRPCWAA